jgi:hypothetical protein
MSIQSIDEAEKQLGIELENTFKTLNIDSYAFNQRLRKYGVISCWEYVLGAHYTDYEKGQNVQFYGTWRDSQSFVRALLNKIIPDMVSTGEMAVKDHKLMIVQRPLLPGCIGDEPIRIGTTATFFDGTPTFEFIESGDSYMDLLHTRTECLGGKAVFGFFKEWLDGFESGDYSRQLATSPEAAGHLISALRRGSELGWELF